MNLYDQTGQRYQLSTTRSAFVVPGVVPVKTYRDVVEEYRTHPEAKSLAPDGRLCMRQTVGVLRRRPVRALYVTHVGKESNRLEEVEAWLVHDPEEVYTEYVDPARDPWRTLVVPVLCAMPRARLVEVTGLSARALAALRQGHSQPQPRHRDQLIAVAATYAAEQLRAAGQAVPSGHLETCAAYLAYLQHQPPASP